MHKAPNIYIANDNTPLRGVNRHGRNNHGLGNNPKLNFQSPPRRPKTPFAKPQTRPIPKPVMPSNDIKPDHWRLKQVGLLLTLIIALCAMNIGAELFGFNLSANDIFAMGSLIGLISFAALKSRMTIMFSLFMITAWTGINGLNHLAGAEIDRSWIGLIPFVLAAQIWIGSKYKSATVLVIAGLLALAAITIYGAALIGQFAAVAGLTFIAGAAQHRIGKAMDDTEAFGANWHNYMGWMTAVLSATYIQQLWMHPDMDGVMINTPTLPVIWILAVVIGALAILASSLLRFQKKRISVTGIVIISTTTLIIPLSIIRPDAVMAMFNSLPGLKAMPGFGLLIGTAIIASAIAMVINGLRLNQIFAITAGTLVVGLQALIVLRPALLSFDFAVITVISLILALSLGGLVAGSSLTDSHPIATR